eukprot:TRINITY_DN2487_c0_g1_i1.p1 TRINITY_DN2487_c0_g1~~TRINITY_DN2487_c0_g1_i1.p1  ORF type:complete len:455 (-),score=74.19 TRINITY_DN2487_c0_g1_i1:20-1384(-)
MRSVIIAILLCIVNANADQITNLPGLPAINFTQYSGYIEVDPNGRSLFYWFVESQRDPVNDKVVLWLNGGPGCSSLGGFLEENGPFRVNPDGETLSLDPYSWNAVANVIYLESPAGVGFSYSPDSSDYTVGDKRTANDAYIFLQKFFKEFPQFSDQPFYVTGESYGGHYVPELADRILYGNKNLQPGDIYINIEGFMAGNPWTYMPIDNYGAVFYWWTHALISDQTFFGINTTCDYSDNGPFKKRQTACDDLMGAAAAEMGNINIYDIYVDVCDSGGQLVDQLAQAGSSFHRALQRGMKKRQDVNPIYQPCADSFTADYLNLPEVQKAIFAWRSENVTWADCNGVVHYNYSDVEKSVIPLYENFFNEGLRILVYSGDVDAIVPYTGTRQWVNDLGRSILEPWRPYILDEQVAGYVTIFDGLTFATVRNAGHMVPQTQPKRAQDMFSKFLYELPF